jgi:hypothetical protein
MTPQKKIEKATGDLIAAGYTKFEDDGSFDPAIHAVRTDGPWPPLCRNQPGATEMDRWNGSAWIRVPQP